MKQFLPERTCWTLVSIVQNQPVKLPFISIKVTPGKVLRLVLWNQNVDNNKVSKYVHIWKVCHTFQTAFSSTILGFNSFELERVLKVIWLKCFFGISLIDLSLYLPITSMSTF